MAFSLIDDEAGAVPVAFSAGSSASVEPVPIVKPEMRPRKRWRPPYMSTSMSTP